MVRSDFMSLENYFDSLSRLINDSYHYISVSVEFFIHILAKENWSITAEVEKAFQLLGGPDTSLDSALEIATSLIKKIWLELPIIEKRLDVLDACLRVLCLNREHVLVIKSFREALETKLFLAPIQLAEIERQTSLWMTAHQLVLRAG